MVGTCGYVIDKAGRGVWHTLMMAEQAHRRPEIASSKLRVPTRTIYYNSFFLLRTEVVLNGQPAEIGCSDDGELCLKCRYFPVPGKYSTEKPSVSFPAISARVEDILKNHGVFEVVNFFCEDAPLFQVTFSSEYSLKKFLRSKKRVEKEMAALLSEMLLPTQQAGAPVIRIPTRVNATLFLMTPDYVTKDCAKPTEVTLENHSSCMAVWKESEVFDFGDVFRVFRLDPTKLPDEGKIRLNTVLSEIFEVDEWVDLGLHLEMEKWQLNTIARDHWNQTVPCKQSMLEVWENQGKASWSALVRALCEIGRIALAKKLAYKFGATLPPVVFRADQKFPTSQEQEEPTLKPDQPSQKESSVQSQLLSSIEHNDHRLEDKTLSVENETENKTKSSENYLLVKRRLSAALSNVDQLYKDKMKLAKQLRSREKTLHALETMSGKQGDLEESIKLLKQDIQQLQDQLDQKDREIAGITVEANSLRAQLQEATAELVSASSELNRLKTEQDTLKVDLERERRELEKEQYKSMFKDDTIKELKGELTTMRTESYSKEREIGVTEGRLLAQSDEVERLQKALHEAEQRKPALPEQPSAATVQQQLLQTMETSDLKVELATAEEGRQEVERQLGALQRQVQFLEEKQQSQKGELTAMTTESKSKERELGVLEGRLFVQSEEVESPRKALHEAEQRKPALPEQPTVQQQLLQTMETSDLKVKLATAEEGRQEVERQLGALQRQVQFLEDEMRTQQEHLVAKVETESAMKVVDRKSHMERDVSLQNDEALDYRAEDVHVFNEVGPMAYNKWRQMGAEMGLNEDALQLIEKEVIAEKEVGKMICFTRILEKLGEVTWLKVVRALESRAVGEQALADKLRELYSGEEPMEETPAYTHKPTPVEYSEVVGKVAAEKWQLAKKAADEIGLKLIEYPEVDDAIPFLYITLGQDGTGRYINELVIICSANSKRALMRMIRKQTDHDGFLSRVFGNKLSGEMNGISTKVIEERKVYEELCKMQISHESVPLIDDPDVTVMHQSKTRQDIPSNKDACVTALHVPPIRGCTVVAERDFPITKNAEVFNWPEYGIAISAPENSLPEGLQVDTVLLKVRVTLSGPFNLGGSKLMSAVYWLCPNVPCKFAKPLEITVEHCALLKRPDDHTKLTFLRTKCNQKDLPYKFEQIEGHFSGSHGTIALTSFSGVAAGTKVSDSDADAKPTELAMDFCAKFVTARQQINEWRAFCVLVKNLVAFLNIVEARKDFAENHFKIITVPSLEFKENSIKFDVPLEGVSSIDGKWKIFPNMKPHFSKVAVEHYESSKAFPECSFVIEWVGSGEPSTSLHHVLKMTGTADEDDFIALHVNHTDQILRPTSVQSPTLDQSAADQDKDSFLGRLCDKPEEKDLVDVAADLKEEILICLAIKLGLKRLDVEKIEKEYSGIMRRFMELFASWKAKATSPYTWKTFVEALEQPTVGEKAVAAELRKRLQD